MVRGAGPQRPIGCQCADREAAFGRGRGDLFFTVQAVTPKKVSKEQRAALEQLAKTLPKEKFEPRARDTEEDDKNIFEKVKDIFG